MPRILAWDTSSKTGSVAALVQEEGAAPRVLAEWTLNLDAVHAERLLWAIDEVLKACDWQLGDLDAIAVGVGPGSFTGLRIGLTAARTLAQETNMPLIAVSSLAALARPIACQLAQHEPRGEILAVTDACKGEVYALWGAASSVARAIHAPFPRGVREEVIELKDFSKVTGSDRRGSWAAVGDALERHPELFRLRSKKLRVMSLDPLGASVQARWVGVLGLESYSTDREASESSEVLPRYLRAPDAERKLKAGLLPVRPEWMVAEPGASGPATRAARSGTRRTKG
ncbi:MAG: tRNA (adenosine(37)-N6)-threonylcarbamoyltransferase complex dimerization subunit type 1 TsaB [Bdellovibrionales bacterium]|nr:tRNA (adenosine(37)-N6)-threonylcarbamoyltransferase complex dimerization subunit type 1 TsaB [Bdellovibrionales bacterium]